MILSFGQSFEFFGARVLNKNDFKKLSHALISLYKFNLIRAFSRLTLVPGAFECSRNRLLNSENSKEENYFKNLCYIFKFFSF